MVATPANALNISATGLVKFDGTATFSGVTVTQHDVLVGAASNGITSVAPSATSGVPLISQGASADPAFGTAVVAGGGTGATSLTGVVIGNGTSAMTASAITQHDVLVGGASNAITSVAPSATSGVPLISQGAAADPAFGTAVVAGGGTGVATLTGLALGSGTSAFTGVTYTAKTSFTPVLKFGGGTTGITYSTQSGLYQQVGNMVFFAIEIILTNKGSSTGAATITGLPVAAAQDFRYFIGVFSVTLTAGNLYPLCQLANGATLFNLYQNDITSSLGTLSDTNFSNSSQVMVEGVYFT